MTQPKFKKHPDLYGKYVTIGVGRGDMRLEDNKVYTGEYLRKFVGHGLLVEVKDPEPEEPASKATTQSQDDGGGDGGADPESASGDDGPTQKELFERAKDLQIEGRSTMDKAELKAAIEKVEAEAQKSEETRPSGTTKSPAGKAAAQQKKSGAGKTSTKK